MNERLPRKRCHTAQAPASQRAGPLHPPEQSSTPLRRWRDGVEQRRGDAPGARPAGLAAAKKASGPFVCRHRGLKFSRRKFSVGDEVHAHWRPRNGASDGHQFPGMSRKLGATAHHHADARRKALVPRASISLSAQRPLRSETLLRRLGRREGCAEAAPPPHA